MKPDSHGAPKPPDIAVALGILFLGQIDNDLARTWLRLQTLRDLVFPSPKEEEDRRDAEEQPDLPTLLRTITECVQDHLSQARQALDELKTLPGGSRAPGDT